MKSELISGKKSAEMTPINLCKYFPSECREGGTVKCTVNVVAEREGRQVSCSYAWESNTLDWLLTSDLQQVELTEVALRLKMLSRKNRGPFLADSDCEFSKIKYHWKRPESEGKRIPVEVNLHEEKFPKICHRSCSLLLFVIPLFFVIAYLVCYFVETQ